MENNTVQPCDECTTVAQLLHNNWLIKTFNKTIPQFKTSASDKILISKTKKIYFMSCQIIIMIEIYTYVSMQRSAVSDLFTISRQHYKCHKSLCRTPQTNYIFETWFQSMILSICMQNISRLQLFLHCSQFSCYHIGQVAFQHPFLELDKNYETCLEKNAWYHSISQYFKKYKNNCKH